MTYTMTHTVTGFANPFLACGQCHGPALGWHNPEACECGAEEKWWLSPCLHKADTVPLCPTWDPVDGCTCHSLCGGS